MQPHFEVPFEILRNKMLFSSHSRPLLSALAFGLLLFGASSRVSAQEGILKPNDEVKLSVFQEDDLTTKTKILKSGEASFPLIGSVKIGGLSVPDATALIKERYAKDFLRDPQVTLTVDSYAVQHVSVVGAVKSPGQIAIPENGSFDLLSAIGSAGGPLENADKGRISLVRASGGQATYSLASLQSSGRVALQPGDRVIVQESVYVRKIVTVIGQVKKPGAVDFPLDGSLDLITSIAMAGGYSDIANEKKVSVSRGGKVTIVNAKAMAEGGGAPYVLQPGDIVNVAERSF